MGLPVITRDRSRPVTCQGEDRLETVQGLDRGRGPGAVVLGLLAGLPVYVVLPGGGSRTSGELYF